jgi:hypothetical protein
VATATKSRSSSGSTGASSTPTALLLATPPSPESTPAPSLDQLASILALVRGAPFAGADPGTWEWADQGTHGSLRSRIDRTITDLAAHVAQAATAAGDADLALWATGQGLRVVPGNDALHRLTLRAAAGHHDRLDHAWTAINRDLATVKETPSPDLTALYQQLRQDPPAP